MNGNGAGTLGNYKGPKEKSTLGGSFHGKESSGVDSGTSSIDQFDSSSASDIGIDYDRDPMTGNATERVKMNPKSGSAKEKGKSFDIC